MVLTITDEDHDDWVLMLLGMRQLGMSESECDAVLEDLVRSIPLRVIRMRKPVVAINQHNHTLVRVCPCMPHFECVTLQRSYTGLFGHKSGVFPTIHTKIITPGTLVAFDDEGRVIEDLQPMVVSRAVAEESLKAIADDFADRMDAVVVE